MGDLTGRFADDQAVRRCDQVDATSKLIASQCLEIERRVLAPQAEPEASLAIEIAVARPHVAAGLGEEWDDIGAKTDRSRSVDPFDRDAGFHAVRPSNTTRKKAWPSARGRTTPPASIVAIVLGSRTYRQRAVTSRTESIFRAKGHGELLARVTSVQPDCRRLDARASAQFRSACATLRPDSRGDGRIARSAIGNEQTIEAQADTRRDRGDTVTSSRSLSASQRNSLFLFHRRGEAGRRAKC